MPEDPETEDRNAPFRQVPFCKYKGHTADLLDLSWSKVRPPPNSFCSLHTFYILPLLTFSHSLPLRFYANLELFPALLLHGQNSPIMAHIQERMSLLLPAH